jgi:hypothetical protein
MTEGAFAPRHGSPPVKRRVDRSPAFAHRVANAAVCRRGPVSRRAKFPNAIDLGLASLIESTDQVDREI